MFWQHVWSTLVGTAAGFIFAIALFYLTERIKRKRDRAKILKGLRRELKFDLGLHESWLKGIEDARPQVAAGDQNIFVYLDYSRFLSIFIVQAVRDGILYDLLTGARNPSPSRDDADKSEAAANDGPEGAAHEPGNRGSNE